MATRWLRRAVVTLGLASGALALGGGVASADLVGDATGIVQDQTATNTNSTTQDAYASAETNQYNVNAPIAILSPGANSGDVDQSNTAYTDATASNDNSTYQSVDQDQSGGGRGGSFVKVEPCVPTPLGTRTPTPPLGLRRRFA